MKTSVLACLLSVAAACGQPGAPASDHGTTMATTAPRASSDLVIVVDAELGLLTNWGYRWKVTVRKVLEGSLADSTLNMETNPNPRGRLYAGRFQLEPNVQRGVKLRLRRDTDRPGLEGFVAKDGTAWQIVGVDEP